MNCSEKNPELLTNNTEEMGLKEVTAIFVFMPFSPY